jgi:hypothetical protein
MNYTKKIILLCMSIIATQSLFAENKDVIYIINNYGDDVAVDLNWYPKPKSWSFLASNQEFIINEFDSYDDELDNKEFIHRYQHKSPYSKYYLAEIKVTPAINKLGKEQAQMAAAGVNVAAHNFAMHTDDKETAANARLVGNLASTATDVGYAIAQSLNEAHIAFDKPTSPSLFLVIEKSDKKSTIKNQKQIKIMKFLSRESYQKHLGISQSIDPRRMQLTW